MYIFDLHKGGISMGTVITFALVTLLALYGLMRALNNKNVLAILFSLGTAGVFGWFTLMTVINSGYPAVVHH